MRLLKVLEIRVLTQVRSKAESGKMVKGLHEVEMEPHSIVVVSLHSPKERLWGQLVEITVAGVTLRGIDLASFDDFVRQVLHPEGERIGLPTLFFPMQRVERVALDEPRGSIPSLAEKFASKAGQTLAEYLSQFA
jgi:hypothetical protein